ncbi:MAG: hypothetical protein ACRDHZ_19950 [Ktedonobacteraceae bacterium]
MRYWMDTEFIDDGKTIDLISIGIVCEDGRELYLQSTELDPRNASPWVKDNVLAKLTMCPHTDLVRDGVPGLYRTDRAYHAKQGGRCTFTSSEGTCGYVPECSWRTREQMKYDIQTFFNPSDDIELWGYYSAYDYVAFTQLFGSIMDLPQGWPRYMRDLQQVIDEREVVDADLPEQPVNQHQRFG